MAESLNRTLIIRFSSVGDVVLSSLLIRVFRKRFPDCQLDVLVKEEFADLVRYNPHVHHVMMFPRGGSFRDLRRLRRDVRMGRYDLIVDIHDSLRSRVLCLGARTVVRVKKRKLARFLLVNMKWNFYERLGGAPSVALRYLEPVRAFGVEDDGLGLEVFVRPETQARVNQMIGGDGFDDATQFIGMCPAAKHNTKMWPKERFAVAAAELSRKHLLPVLLFGVETERMRCDETAHGAKALNPDVRVINMAGRLSLEETAAAMDRCAVVLTNDSGLMHIASARKRPVAALFGPTVREFGFFPFGTRHVVIEHESLDCRPCTHIGGAVCPRQHFRCMNELDVPRVVAAVNTLLQSS